MHRNKSVDVHQFAMVPRADIPRAAFRMQKALKTTFDCGYLVPIFCEEVLPGDSFNVKLTAFCRLATPLFPVMDNLTLTTFFFFVPNRLTWQNWVRFMGQQNTPASSIDYTVPIIESKVGGYDVGSIFDMFGLPCAGQVEAASTYEHSALPLRAYKLIYQHWFKDENLVDTPVTVTTDGPDLYTLYEMYRRGKRHDYFTACLPWTQKGGVDITMPLSGTAPVLGIGKVTNEFTPGPVNARESDGNVQAYANFSNIDQTATGDRYYVEEGGVRFGVADFPGIYADLSAATGATINQLRQSFQIQKLLERDARGGTRYAEIVRSHFGVVSPDARLQRPEYLGGGQTPVVINPIAQTSASAIDGSDTPQGNLAAMGTALARGHGFSQSFTEHGYIIGIASVQADLTYQQGLRRHWSRQTRYDYYFPAFAMLGEQAVLSKEIYCTGEAGDEDVFGYQERWAEYRYNPSEICGLFRSTAAGTIDAWHLSQHFTARPTLNDDFINDTPPVERILAVGESANGQQLLFDGFYDCKVARPMPLYSVPGLIDHF